MPTITHRLWSATAAAFWDLHSLTWDGGAPPAAVAARTAAVLAWARAHAAPGARVLDVGCATGTHALALASAGYHVVGIDHAPGMLRRARAKAARRPGAAVTFVQADLTRPFPPTLGGFDLVLCFGVVQCVPDAAALLTALHGVLAPGGVVLVEVKDAAAPPPVVAGHSAASRTFAPLKRWASARGARPVTRAQLAAALGAAGLRAAEDRGAAGWLRVAARPAERTS